ncbi:TPA: hypothetical protein DD799_02565 [Candidatus Dependentiae bacterium]|nr:hypothetical protein [Candidatus Dependentiae bacterium]
MQNVTKYHVTPLLIAQQTASKRLPKVFVENNVEMPLKTVQNHVHQLHPMNVFHASTAVMIMV